MQDALSEYLGFLHRRIFSGIIKVMNNFEQPPKKESLENKNLGTEMPRPESSKPTEEVDTGKEPKPKVTTEKGSEPLEAEKKEEFDLEKSKQDYVASRLEYADTSAEYNRLSEEQNKAADALIANPKDLDAQTNFWRVSGQLDSITKKRDQAGSVERGVANRLLDQEEGGNYLVDAEALYRAKRRELFPNLPEGLPKTERMIAIEERLNRCRRLEQKMKELDDEVANLINYYNNLAKESQKLQQEGAVILKTERNDVGIEKLKENSAKRKRILDEMDSVNDKLEEMTSRYKKIGEEIRGSE